jgi:pimeloyl-ACP methyl ester carboxylesterase
MGRSRALRPTQALVWATVRAGLWLAPSTTLRIQLGQVTTLEAASLVRNMDSATRRQLVEVYRSLWSGRGFRCDLGHTSSSDEPIARPALIMRGVHDPSVPAAHAARLHALFAENECIELDAESHLIWLGRSADEVWRTPALVPATVLRLTAPSSPDCGPGSGGRTLGSDMCGMGLSTPVE